ncbi:hypothetical protein ACP275_08G100300 [Erythranthe tilingii]
MDPPKKKISLKSYSDLPKKKKRSSYPLKSSPISFFFPLRRVQESITHATKSCPLQKEVANWSAYYFYCRYLTFTRANRIAS